MSGAMAGSALLELEETKMAGAMGGSATLSLDKASKLELLTVTVNNQCNLSCPQCYLQYDGKLHYANKEILDAIVNSNYSTLAIVGMEPLYNKETIKKTANLIQRTTDSGKKVSLITNGRNLHLLPSNIADKLNMLDISLDGGPRTYERARSGKYSTLIDKIQHKNIPTSALHVLYKENLRNLNDMVSIENDYDFKHILFSPIMPVRSQGTITATEITMADILKQLVNSNNFMDSTPSKLFTDIFFLEREGTPVDTFKDQVQKYGLKDKVVLTETDPLHSGVMRLTYDGRVLAPKDTLDTSLYKSKGIGKGYKNLSESYKRLIA